MNTDRIQRKLNILRLRFRSAFYRVIAELEPAGSTEARQVLKNYNRAHSELRRAVLKDREIEMNRRVF